MTFATANDTSRALEILADGPLLMLASLTFMAAFVLVLAWFEGAVRGHRAGHARIVLALRVAIAGVCAYMVALIVAAVGTASVGWIAAQLAQVLVLVGIERLASWEARRDRSRDPVRTARPVRRLRRPEALVLVAGLLALPALASAGGPAVAAAVAALGLGIVVWSRRRGAQELAR